MNFKNILIPVDNDGFAEDAIDKGLELAKLSGGSITALHVSAKAVSDETGERSTIEEVIAKGKEAGIQVSDKIEIGSPAEIIIKESNNYDIIVMGTAGKKRFFVGSVAKEVIKSAACPVIVVKSQR